MVNKALSDYIEKHLEKGVRLREIKNTLAKAGHPVPEIESAVADINAKKPHLKKTKPFSHVFYVSALVLIAVIGGLIVAGLVSEKLSFDVLRQEVRRNQTLEASSDIDLLLLAKANDDMFYCSFIDDHNYYYACMEKWWAKNDCSWELLMGEDVIACKTKNNIGADLFNRYCKPFESETACLSAAAVGENDVEICGISDDCIYSFALITQNSQVCSLLGPAKDDCIFDIAVNSSNKELCAELENSEDCFFQTKTLEEKAEQINSFYYSNIQGKSPSSEDYANWLSFVFDSGLVDICPKLKGEFKQFSAEEFCDFFFVSTNLLASFREPAKPFDKDLNQRLCSSIGNDFLSSCCNVIVSERFIKPECEVSRYYP